MTDLSFLALATVTVASAILALEARDLVYGAAALGISFLGIAGLFFLLDASYTGVFQIAVYIGAVVVLILFTVMLVGPQLGEPPLELKRLSLLTALLVSLLLGTAGSLTSAASFPGPDSCGAGCYKPATKCYKPLQPATKGRREALARVCCQDSAPKF